MQLKKSQMIKCGIIITCLWFTFFLYILYGQNMYLAINFESCERSEKSDSYSIIAYDGVTNYREEKSGGIYEKSVREKFPLGFDEDLNVNIYLNPITEKVKINNISLYYNQIKISEIAGEEVTREFGLENAKVAELSEKNITLENAGESAPILLWRNYGQELKMIHIIQGMKAFQLLVIVCFISVLIIEINKRAGMWTTQKKCLNPNIVMLGLLVVVSGLIFFSYLTGEKYFAFTMSDIASDSINQIVPITMQQARELENIGEVCPWSFEYGLGGEAQCDIFNYMITVFGSKNVLYMLGAATVLKCILAGMIFFQYTRLLDISNSLKYVAAMSYAFCGHMIVRSGWFGYSKEVIFVAFLIFAIEKWAKDSKWQWIPLAYALLFCYSGIFVTIIWIVVGCGYYIMRRSLQNGTCVSEIGKSIGIWAIFIGVGGLIAGYKLIPAILEMVNSNRVHSMVSSIGGTESNMIQYFIPYTWREIAKSVLRAFSNNILGVNNYRGVQNYLADIPLYSGLFTILLAPQALVIGTKKEKKWNLVLYLICVYYICFPTIRSIVNAFSDRYNSRMSSFWINVVLIYIGVHTLNHIIREKKCVEWLLILTMVMESVFLILSAWKLGSVDAQKECIKAVIFLLLLTSVLLCFLHKWINQKTANGLIICLSAFEIVLISYPAVNDRYVVTKDELNNAYEDGTTELLSEINDNSFYRVNKTYQSVGLNDALYQNYSGTRSYLGGTTHSNDLLDFTESIGVKNMYSSTSYLLGFDGLNSVNTMLGVKYNLARDEKQPYGYEMVKNEGHLWLSENKNSLPLGFGYDSVISEENYYELNVYDRREVLLNSVVVKNDSDWLETSGIEKISSYNEYETIADRSSNVLKFNDTESYANLFENKILQIPHQGKAVFDVEDTESGNLIIFTDVNCSTRSNTYVTYRYKMEDGSYEDITRILYLQIGKNHVRLDIDMENLSQIVIRTERAVEFEVDNLSTTYMDDSVYASYEQNCQDRRKDVLEIVEMEGDRIKGKITNTSSDVLFLSIPYDEDWHIYVDGREVMVEKLNIAFIGCRIPKGEHDVEIRFEKDDPYILYSCGAFLGYVFAEIVVEMYRYRKKKRSAIARKR
ncbi:YfhO family protein [Roseburia sp. 499]|uniref:YfhO family protein n=1 Tax=Roseburia sp. 499 TaxID=1261634 RepID=UPI0009530D15|nr:YfhO family protein [Roseburia sp. 499]WVK69292.1 YfhO family protein [Roseburia sp. 499]